MTLSPPTDVPTKHEEPAGRGLAIASVIVGLLGPLAIVGLALGIAALMVSSKPGKGGARSIAISGTIISAVVLVCTCGATILGGGILAALGRARNQARQLKSAAQLTNVGRGFSTYAAANKDWFPPPGSDWQMLLTSAGVAPADLIPIASKIKQPFIYVPPNTTLKQIKMPGLHIVAFEDPADFRDKGTNVLYADGHVDYVMDLSVLKDLRLSDGSTYTPPKAPSARR